jgi:hypothetical protein
MIRKKNSFFTFIFSTMFGAGHMYMGFMKQGISIMTAAAIIIAAGSWVRIGTVFFALPVLWFYSFFDAINKMTMPERIFQTLEDHYMFIPSGDNVQLKNLITKYEKAIAVILILIGGSILGENILDFIAEQASIADNTGLADFISSLRWNGSRLLFAVVIIVIGVKMIIGKKNELDMEETNMEEINMKEINMKKNVINHGELKANVNNETSFESDTLFLNSNLLQDTKAQDTKAQDIKIQDIKIQDTKAQDTKAQDTKIQDIKIQDIKIQDTKAQDTKAQDTKEQDTKVQNTEVQNTKVQDTSSYNKPMNAAAEGFSKEDMDENA